MDKRFLKVCTYVVRSTIPCLSNSGVNDSLKILYLYLLIAINHKCLDFGLKYISNFIEVGALAFHIILPQE